MAVLSKVGITNNSTIQASHITQSIDALTGQVTDYNITISGSLAVTGSFGVFKSNTNNRVFYITTGSNSIEQHYLVPDVRDWVVGQDGKDNKFKISSADNSFASQNVGLTISSSGEVSIGTTSSLARLHVNPASTPNLITSLFTIGQSDNNFKAGFANGAGSTTGSEHAKVGMWYNPTVNSTADPVTHIGFIRGNSGDSSGMTFNVNNTEMMRISSTGAITASGAISSSAGLFGTTLTTTGAITASGAISSSAGLFGTTLTTTGTITSSGAISSSAGLFGTTLTTTGAITSSGAISSSAGLFGTTLRTSGAITSSGAISSSAGLFSTTLTTTGAITSSGAISSSAGLFSTTLTTTGAITASIISASSGITASSVTVGTILTLTPYTATLPTTFPSGSLAVSGSGTAMRLYLWNGGTWTAQA